MAQRYSRINYVSGKLLLAWHTGNLNGTLTEHVQTSSEQPTPEFVKAFNAFQKPIEKLLAVLSDHTGDAGAALYFDAVVGIKILEEKETPTDSIPRGIMVTLAKKIDASDSPFLATTPRLEINATFKRKMEQLEYHAERFALGARAQGTLFPAGETVTTEAPAPEEEQVPPGAGDAEWEAAVARGKALQLEQGYPTGERTVDSETVAG